MNGDFSLADSVIQVYHEWEIKEALALFIYKPVEWNLLPTLFVLNKKVGKDFDYLLLHWKVLTSRNSVEACNVRFLILHE